MIAIDVTKAVIAIIHKKISPNLVKMKIIIHQMDAFQLILILLNTEELQKSSVIQRRIYLTSRQGDILSLKLNWTVILIVGIDIMKVIY